MPMPITMAFKRITKKGCPVYRINVNTTELLSYLEEGKTEVRIDVIPKEIHGCSKGRKWDAVRYYTWATVPQPKPVEAVC